MESYKTPKLRRESLLAKVELRMIHSYLRGHVVLKWMLQPENTLFEPRLEFSPNTK